MCTLEMDHITGKLSELEPISHNSCESNEIQRNLDLIESITVEQLDLIEQDLEVYEKVALCFLLYGYQYSQIGQQKLEIGFKSRNVYLLSEWVRTIVSRNAYMANIWRELLIEALCIAQINHVLLKFGLDVDELNTRFFPSNRDMNLFVHPVLKCLYQMCEQLTPKQTEEMITWIDRNANHTTTSVYPALLEMHILSWINNAVIHIGDWKFGQPNKDMKKFSEVTIVTRYLAENSLLTDIRLALNNVVMRVNFTKNNYITCKLGEDSGQKSESASKLTMSLKEEVVESSAGGKSKLGRYPVRKETAGYILIINQREFEPNLKNPKNSLHPRIGTDFDRDLLSATFTPFGYEAIIAENLTETQIISEVNNVAMKSKAKDSIIVCILSHGKSGTIFSSDNIQVSIKEIQRAIAIEELKDKPKILIIQACQEAETENHERIPEVNKKAVKKCPADWLQNMLTTHSTIDGYVSYRERTVGSWFIQTLCENIKADGGASHMNDLFTLVQQTFQAKKGPAGERMVPMQTNSFSQHFFLPRL